MKVSELKEDEIKKIFREALTEEERKTLLELLLKVLEKLEEYKKKLLLEIEL